MTLVERMCIPWMQISQSKSSNTLLRRVLRSDEFGVLIPLLGIVLVATAIRPDFLSVGNFSAMFMQIPFIAVTALGCSFPLMCGNVDISTGRVAGFAGIFMAKLAVDNGWPALPAIVVPLAICMLIGLVNGVLVVIFKVSDFVVTMGTLYMVGGARYLFIKGYELAFNRAENFTITEIFRNNYFGMPIYFWIMLLLFGITYVVIKKTTWGRQILAVGDNREVAQLAGIKVKHVRIIAYVVSAFLSGVAGIMLTLNLGIGKPETGDGWEFRAIAGCVVGGTSLAGGKSSPLGILIGITLVFVAENAIIFIGLPTTLRVSVQGFLMAGAVLFDMYKQRRKIPG